jgi:iron(III) transport system ATP-binding protein
VSASVVLREISKQFPGKNLVPAVDRLELELAEGELIVLLGPSGCGKTTTLRCVAGLEDPTAGTIEIGGRVVFDKAAGIAVPPNKRDIGMVFQSYALWPHKTVRANIAYPLKGRGKRDKIDEWVPAVADMVSCGPLLDRLPSQLSGGQQQRVALARGLVARPGVVLFDEPLSNLDARLRDQVRGELHQLHQELGFSGLYVTHDQQEALALGDRLAVMNAGRIEHLGNPREVYDRPATRYVAEFVGFLNHVQLSWHDGGWRCGDGEPVGLVPRGPVGSGELTLCVRPEDLQVVPAGEPLPTGFAMTGAVVRDRVYSGRTVELSLAAGDAKLRASIDIRTDDRRGLLAGAGVVIGFDVDACVVYDAAGDRIDVDWTAVGAARPAESSVAG